MEKVDLYVRGHFYKEVVLNKTLLTYDTYREYIHCNDFPYINMKDIDFVSTTCTSTVDVVHFSILQYDDYNGNVQLHCNDENITIGKKGLIKIKKEEIKNNIRNEEYSRFDIMEIE